MLRKPICVFVCMEREGCDRKNCWSAVGFTPFQKTIVCINVVISLTVPKEVKRHSSRVSSERHYDLSVITS